MPGFSSVWGVELVYHAKLPRDQHNGKDGGEGVSLANSTGGREWGAIGGSELYDPIGVSVQVMPSVRERLREAHVYKHVTSERRIKRVEE